MLLQEVSFVALFLFAGVAPVAPLAEWSFDTEADRAAWVPNAHLEKVRLKDGVLEAEAVNWDPFFICEGLEIAANPWQFVLVKIKANRGGVCDVFWTGTSEGPYGGFSEEKKCSIKVPHDGAWHELAGFPAWHAERTIRKLRFDVYDGAHFEIDSIRILQWGRDEAPAGDTFSWEFGRNPDQWHIHPAVTEKFAPPLRLAVAERGWVTVRMRSQRDGIASILWSGPRLVGLRSESFPVRGDGTLHSYNLELQGNPDWNELVLLGLRLPPDTPEMQVESVRIAARPSGPPEITATYFGFENAVNRAGSSARVRAQLTNLGGEEATQVTVKLRLPSDVQLRGSNTEQTLNAVALGVREDLTWEVVAERDGAYSATLELEGEGAPEPLKTQLHFTPPLNLAPTDYVPEPRPVATDLEVCAFYFPGWDSAAKWDCIRRIAPIRKPLLGYYDESSPECVDWQIKWAVENGISCFLVDWYWTQGQQILTHWFEAYRKARYRDMLKVAIMWANHNPPNTHSAEDFRKVTQHWIDHYFGLKSYYRIDHKPAVFIWDPENIRNDLKGSAAVKATLDESQAMAQAAGYDGIVYIAVNRVESPAHVRMCIEEGYCGATNYHEWGNAVERAPEPKRFRYADVVETCPAVWARRDAMDGTLVYYPLVETGWDSRPWHGDKSMVIDGRTPELFERLLRDGKQYCRDHGKKMMVLGPVNEWGEGSYIEPCAEFGFEMLEAVRKVVATGDPSSWPVNVAPSDVGRGPYDYPPVAKITAWTFDQDAGGWKAMMNVGEPVCRQGALRFRTTSEDPALMVDTPRMEAAEFSGVEIRMQLTGNVKTGSVGQLFWSPGGGAMVEATSVHFPLAVDGQPHHYQLDLKANPRWRGRISTLRLDPCESRDVEVNIEEIRFVRQ
ncbi:MAG: glycoside hydrolase family 99-like domain-containing protein [Candidatus Hydrogenedentes bacterium]|nr:glycoside hydrolase family 99-like domain-containing protein [Candidatus Hydrogenedentota bacterium]